MKQVHGITSRGVVKNDIRCALLMSQADREAREHLRLSMGRNITYATFEYEPVTRPVPAIERKYPGDTMPADTGCNYTYWNPSSYGPGVVGRSHVHVRAKNGGRITFGTAALRAAAQAKVRELMATRASARRAEWAALQGAISNSQSAVA